MSPPFMTMKPFPTYETQPHPILPFLSQQPPPPPSTSATSIQVKSCYPHSYPSPNLASTLREGALCKCLLKGSGFRKICQRAGSFSQSLQMLQKAEVFSGPVQISPALFWDLCQVLHWVLPWSYITEKVSTL